MKPDSKGLSDEFTSLKCSGDTIKHEHIVIVR